MRGKQVIICGDTKQLPPTYFFGTKYSNDDEYDYEDENEAEEYLSSSILDEASVILPERTLKWHYRSNHEHLIAFSNAKIYNNRLITFPSNQQATDMGVEYIFVADGVYNRGKSRNNVKEAEKVADLVFKHFRKYPQKSLGVVTFSGAQQAAVDTAIRHKRLNDQTCESFFLEDISEPFFIKNLETVQGDERDTIILSIGYAKDETGKPMAMNLGPLSQVGGERRLNVAITRAKDNIKLVGSIQPGDLDLSKSNSLGVKLLRSYIEFAQNGEGVLIGDEATQKTTDFESLFEEAIYTFLTSKGYNVSTQIGCSGYRIELAVRHPEIENLFVLGIECDGASYHSARTARERDRIRQDVLENMGWKIYRIWSTDWIKDPLTEGNKLIQVIEKIFKEETNSPILNTLENCELILPESPLVEDPFV